MLGSRSFNLISARKERETGEEKAQDTKKHGFPPSSRSFGWRPNYLKTTTPSSDASTEAFASITTPARSTLKTTRQPSLDTSIAVESSADRGDEDVPRSRPVAVPGKRRPRGTHRRNDAAPGISSQSDRSSAKHDPTAMPPSVAALLAMTSIPRKSSFPSQWKSSARTLSRQYSSQSLMEEWKQSDLGNNGSLGSSPNMHILLSPPEHAHSLSRSSSEETLDPCSTVDPPSAESLPSLTADDCSISSSVLKNPREIPRRANREKAPSFSESLGNDFEHPLSFKDDVQGPDDGDNVFEPPESSSSQPSSPDKRKPFSFKSNLTASLTAIKSSWRSLSNFASTPYTLPEDYLSRGLFAESQLIHREMRPRPLDRPPSAEMRRYFNPSQYHASPHMDFHHHGSVMEHMDYDHITTTTVSSEPAEEGSIIALQDRSSSQTSPRMSSGSYSASDLDSTLTEAGRAMHESNQQYRREIRENSEWLRICVLETNMRRAGKIDGPGHAKLWLQAREVTRVDTRLENIQLGSAKVPARWVPMACG